MGNAKFQANKKAGSNRPFPCALPVAGANVAPGYSMPRFENRLLKRAT